ncbi:uncharacterized protein LOC144710534 isoform X2 [Wolffia australiana]
MWRKRKARTNSEFQHGASPNISSQLALDEAVAKALQYYENKLAAASPTQEPSMPDNGSSSSSSEDNSPISSPSDLVTQQDPDAMSYEFTHDRNCNPLQKQWALKQGVCQMSSSPSCHLLYTRRNLSQEISMMVLTVSAFRCSQMCNLLHVL